MKIIAILILSILMLASCEHQSSLQTTTLVGQIATTQQYDSAPAPRESLPRLEHHPIFDETGIVKYTFLYPTNWKQDHNDSSVILKNEHDAKIFHEVTSVWYAHHKSNRDNRYFKKQGNHISKVKSFEEILNEFILPVTDSLHVQLEPYYNIQTLGDRKHEYYDHFISMNRPDTTRIETIAIEGIDTLGIKSIGYITRIVHEYDDYTSWSFSIQSMEAPLAVFENAKVEFLASLEMWLFGYDYIYRSNQRVIQAITNNRTHQYFTPREDFIRFKKISAEQSRTGCHSYQVMHKYMQEVLSKNWEQGDFKDIPVDYSKVPKNPYQDID